MGRLASSPPSKRLVAGFMLPSVVGPKPPHHAVRQETVGQSKARGLLPQEVSQHYSRPPWLSRPGDATSRSKACRFCSNPFPWRSAYAAAGAGLPQRNALPSTHMRCSTLASFLANATFARFAPRRLATSIAQRLSVEKRVVRLSNTLAAS